MHSTVRIVILSLFVAGLVIGATAQQKEISREEFDRMKTVADRVLETMPYRVKSRHETFSDLDSKPDKTSLWITEYIRPNREHSFHGLNSSDPSDKYERIRVGDRIFMKRDGKWTELKYSGDSGFGLSAGPESIKYLIIGTEKVNGIEAKVYDLVSSHKFWIGRTEKNSVYHEKYWISQNGRILMTVGESDGIGSKRSRTTEIYEYDSKIKIEIPIKL